MITYRTRCLTHGEIWFDDDPPLRPVDWIQYHQRSKPLAQGKWREFYTRVVDISQSPRDLMAQMDRNTAEDIKKATTKHGVTCHREEAEQPAVLKSFCDFYDRFAAVKGIPKIDRNWMSQTIRAKALDIWTAQDQDHQKLIWYSVYVGSRCVRGLFRASLDRSGCDSAVRQILGRANRLLSWELMLYYRAKGLTAYDMGGWYNGDTDTAKLGINRFKKGFGGTVVKQYEGERIITLRAWGVLSVARLLSSMKQARSEQPVQLPALRPTEQPHAQPAREACAS